MKTIKAVIVEDSRLARNELKELIKISKEIEIIGEAENVDDAYKLIQTKKPDLLFLDINMPEKDGFDLLEMLDEAPITVFTTAYNEYAIKSFEYNALDYLLKPISESRYLSAIEKVKNKFSDNEKEVIHEKKLTANSQIFIKDGEKCWLVKVEDIIYFEIVGNYTRVYFKEEKPLIYKSLNQIEEKLPQDKFFRANRQQIINTDYIRNVVPWFNDKLKLVMVNESEIEISRRQSYLFKDIMSI